LFEWIWIRITDMHYALLLFYLKFSLCVWFTFSFI